MDNTVGSYVNKHWQKKWLPLKQSLVLTKEQKSVLIGSLLGDGTLRKGAGAINVNFKVEHGLRQKEYVLWKYKIFKSWVTTGPKISYRYRENGDKYEKSWWFRTVRHPILTEFWKRFYVDGRKVVPLDIERDLNPAALAVWVMDDGSYARSKIDISTYAFTLSEIIILKKALEKNFGVNAKYFQDRDKGYRMYFNVPDSKILAMAIEPYVIPSLAYKINHNPVTTDSLGTQRDEILSKIA